MNGDLDILLDKYFQGILNELIQLARLAEVFDEPWFQHKLNTILLSKDPELAKTVIDQIRPLAYKRV